ncbi:MAG TPA: hypothetical protein PLD59_10995 [Tepidisphaeraceae bacterium]|nr:hypothetical protein [Tepidisphaeraceae bacterium]
MKLREAIEQVLEHLPEDRQKQVLDFARFIAAERDGEQWRAAGRHGLARAFGEDEPEYTWPPPKQGAEQ